MARSVKALLVVSHPVQYASHLWRRYEADRRIDVTVAYCSLQGAQPGIDPDFGVEVAWDVPLLDGYRWVHPPNRAPRPALRRFFGLLNPGVWPLIRRGGFDLVICYGWRAASFWIAAVAARVSGASVVFTTDGHTLAPRHGRRWKPPLKRALIRGVIGFADGILAPSTRTVTLIRSLGSTRDRVFLTPYVVDNAHFARAAGGADPAGLRRTWKVPAEASIALFVGKLVPWKRPMDILEAAATVPGLHVVLAGDGPLRADLEARSGRSDLAGRVHFLGFTNQTKLPGVYAASDFLVLPSEHEPFGLVVNEAFAVGRPAVVTEACGAAGDLVRDGETGYVVPTASVTALSARLRWLAEDEGLRRAMGAAARRRISAWGPEQNVEAFVSACVALARPRAHRIRG